MRFFKEVRFLSQICSIPLFQNYFTSSDPHPDTYLSLFLTHHLNIWYILLTFDSGILSGNLSIWLYIHPASRGVAAHTAGLIRSVRGAKGGFPPWGLFKLRSFNKKSFQNIVFDSVFPMFPVKQTVIYTFFAIKAVNPSKTLLLTVFL